MLGVETDTLDADGAIVATRDGRRAPRPEVEAARSRRRLGSSMQRPPAYSAVKVGGRKLYEAARAGEALEAPERPIRVDAFSVRSFESPDGRLRGDLFGRDLRPGPPRRRRACARVRRAPHRAAPHRDRAVPGRGRRRAPTSRRAPADRARRRASAAGRTSARTRRRRRPRVDPRARRHRRALRRASARTGA